MSFCLFRANVFINFKIILFWNIVSVTLQSKSNKGLLFERGFLVGNMRCPSDNNSSPACPTSGHWACRVRSRLLAPLTYTWATRKYCARKLAPAGPGRALFGHQWGCQSPGTRGPGVFGTARNRNDGVFILIFFYLKRKIFDLGTDIHIFWEGITFFYSQDLDQ